MEYRSKPYGQKFNRIAPSRLPRGSEYLVGRGDELEFLTSNLRLGNRNVLCVVAAGGVGKSALVAHWRSELSRNNWVGLDRVFDWSFYSQGSSDDRLVSGEAFISSALRFFDVDLSGNESPSQLGEKLANAVRELPSLVILDGLEPLQYPMNSGPRSGHLKSVEVDSFLRNIAKRNTGLCIVTSRQAVVELYPLEGSTVESIFLQPLSVQSGAELLKYLGVNGDDGAIRRVAGEFGGHSLALNLLGTYLRDAAAGDIRRYREVDLLSGADHYGGHARRVMRSYERWFGYGPEIELMRIIGLFDRPAVRSELEAVISGPPITNLTRHLAAGGFGSSAVTRLVRAKLISVSRDSASGDIFDAHPLVRQYFADVVERHHNDAWKQGHFRLFRYLASVATETPESLEEMMPLFAAVLHGCKAGVPERTYQDIYEPRIKVGELLPDARRLGGLGSNLSVIGGYFEKRWSKPSPDLSPPTRDEVLNEAAFALRSVGLLRDAATPLELAFEGFSARHDFVKAATAAGNLGELYMTLGNMDGAERFADLGVSAGESSRIYGRHWWTQVAKRADLHFNRGLMTSAAEGFRWAEITQREHVRENPRLFGVLSFKYCEFLREEIAVALRAGGVSAEALYLLQGVTPLSSPYLLEKANALVERARHMRDLDSTRGIVLHVALGEVALGLAQWTRAVLDGPPLNTAILDQLVGSEQLVRSAGREEYLPPAILATGIGYLASSQIDSAESCADRAHDIAIRAGMKLQEIEVERFRALVAAARGSIDEAESLSRSALQAATDVHYGRRVEELSSLVEFFSQRAE